ncbi:MAG: ABC transporter substrate-binding protein [Clostridia bacterium]|nr:ABC transporter substrate-binding protein [Clostridia bacterium]MBR4444192.1 ABC transporter substrate-binding protein [Clostridia bacterium]
MTNLKRILCLVCAFAMLLGCCASLADEAKLEPATLEWYVATDQLPDNAVVFDALNAYFGEKINAAINFHFIAPSEYSEKVSPILMSGQEVDIINANSGIGYVDYVKKDSFLPIEDLLAQYAPETVAMIPEGLWDAMKVDGHIYGIPSYKDSVQMYAVMINETMANDIGLELPATVKNYQEMVPIIREAFAKRNELHPEYKLSDTEYVPITRFFPDLDQWAQYETINGLAVVNVPGIEAYAGMGAGETVFNKFATQEYRDLCKTIADLVAEGVLHDNPWYWDPDRLYSDDPLAYLIGDVGSGYVTVAKHQYSQNWDTLMVPFADNIATTNYLQAAVNCVSITSKNPERAVMALELINTDPFVATTLRFGIEGTHWVQTEEENVISFAGTKNADSGSRGHYYWYGANFGALVYSKVPEGYPNNFVDLIKAANESAISETNLGFIFDPTNVTNEIAACSAVIDEFQTPLKWGWIAADEIDANIDDFLAKLNASGAEKIVAEAQAQLDTWRAANK